MANINQISLKICGNPDANSGFQPMVIFNSPSIEIKDTVYSGFDANSFFFTIRIEKDQVVYKLVKNNVSSLGANRQGCLFIGIAIPKGYKLDDGVSPYDVLIKLKNEFLLRCMTCKDPATNKYEFNSNRVQSNILDDIAGSFSLVSSQTPHYTMSIGAPIAYVTAPEQKIKMLMNDVQYRAFAQFSEIVVAASVQSTNYTPINISIPRKPEYSLYDDGVPQHKLLSDPKEPVTVNGNGDVRFYENESLTFTLEDLLDGKSVPNVSIDRVNEIINVSSNALKKPITRKINIVFVPEEAQTYFYTNKSDWNLICKNMTIPLADDLSFELKGEKLNDFYQPQNFRINQSTKDQFEVKDISISDSSYEILVTAEKVRRTSHPVGTTKTKSGIAQTTNINACEVQLSIIFSDQGSDCCRCNVGFYRADGDLLLRAKTSFEKGNDDNYIARGLYVPKSWAASNIYVSFKYKNEYWSSNRPLGKDVNGIIKLHDNDFTRKHIGFFSKYSRRITLLILVFLSLLVGGVIGTYIGKTWSGKGEDLEGVRACATSSDFYCSYCNTSFNQQSDLDVHMSNNCSKRVKCDKCDERFASEHEMEKHKNDVHTYECNICKEKFNNEEDLNLHLKNNQHLKCDICGSDVYFETSEELDAHKWENHHFACDVCGDSVWFKTKEELKAHKDKEHHFACEECVPSVWFKTKEELENHKRLTKVRGANRYHRR